MEEALQCKKGCKAVALSGALFQPTPMTGTGQEANC